MRCSPLHPLETHERHNPPRCACQVSLCLEHRTQVSIRARCLISQPLRQTFIKHNAPILTRNLAWAETLRGLGPPTRTTRPMSTRVQRRRASHADRMYAERRGGSGNQHRFSRPGPYRRLAVDEQLSPSEMLRRDRVMWRVDQRRTIERCARDRGDGIGRSINDALSVLRCPARGPQRITHIRATLRPATVDSEECGSPSDCRASGVVRMDCLSDPPRSAVNHQPRVPLIVALNFDKVVAAPKRPKLNTSVPSGGGPQRHDGKRHRIQRIWKWRSVKRCLTQDANPRANAMQNLAKAGAFVAPVGGSPQHRRGVAAPNVAPDRVGIHERFSCDNASVANPRARVGIGKHDDASDIRERRCGRELLLGLGIQLTGKPGMNGSSVMVIRGHRGPPLRNRS